MREQSWMSWTWSSYYGTSCVMVTKMWPTPICQEKKKLDIAFATWSKVWFGQSKKFTSSGHLSDETATTYCQSLS